MPALKNERTRRGLRPIRLSRLISAPRIGGALLTVTALLCADCKRPAPQARHEPAEQNAAESPRASSPTPEREKKAVVREVQAVWYDVPDKSLAKRRAGVDELTAAVVTSRQWDHASEPRYTMSGGHDREDP